MHSQSENTGRNPNGQWRLIKSSPSSAAFNMSLDEALLISTAQKHALPTLRLYSWMVPSISLGYAQPSLDVDQQELSNHAWQLVRRPTGGKAILHTDELTYSISAPLDEPLVLGSLLESYQRISLGLQKALQQLGLQTIAENKSDLPDEHSRTEPVCFQTPSNYEITWKNKKLIGSAQARKHSGVLQHGSLPLCGDLSRITQVLAYPSQMDRDTAAQKTLARATTLEDATGKIFTWGEAADAIIRSFSAEFGITFLESLPTQEEMDITSFLVQSKYDSHSWNYRI